MRIRQAAGAVPVHERKQEQILSQTSAARRYPLTHAVHVRVVRRGGRRRLHRETVMSRFASASRRQFLRTPRRAVRVLAAGCIAAACALFLSAAPAATFTVGSTADVHDANAGDGACETAPGNHVCTLRAAIEEANAHAGPDVIAVPPAAYLMSLTTTLDSSTADLVITDSVTINGGGRDATIIDGNGTGSRLLIIARCVNDNYDSTAMQCVVGEVSVSVSGLTMRNGFATNVGGGIINYATLALDRVAVTGNTVSGLNDWGGGMYSAGPLTMTNCLVADNHTGAHNAYGGAIYSQATLTISNSTFRDNSTLGGASSPGLGGALFLVSSAPVVIRNSTLSGNSAQFGGGIYMSGQSLVLINDTISGNDSAGSGGGLYVKYGTTGLYNVTVTQNRANADDSGSEAGGGIANSSGTLTVLNSIVASNTRVIPTMPLPTLDVDECLGTITSQGYNIIEFVDTSHCTVNGAYATDSPELGPLQANGGTTLTHAPALGSKPIDGGNPSGCTDNVGAPVTSDQRGVPRPYGSACDMGAVEYADIIFKNGFNP
jgi:CSLREA domain-containing protein